MDKYQQFGYFNKSGVLPSNKPKEPVKEWVLYENGNEVQRGAYSLLVYKRDELIRRGLPKHLIKIKPLTTRAKK